MPWVWLMLATLALAPGAEGASDALTGSSMQELRAGSAIYVRDGRVSEATTLVDVRLAYGPGSPSRHRIFLESSFVLAVGSFTLFEWLLGAEIDLALPLRHLYLCPRVGGIVGVVAAYAGGAPVYGGSLAAGVK